MNIESKTLRKPTNLSLEHGLLKEAKALKINLSRAAEEGLRQAVSRAKSEQWKQENKIALESINKFVEDHGLPLAKYRNF